ncbi:uncharacterized protein KQ657_002154 [Scheffersomyces spartinae]|uniref:Suppressor of G2 allele of SKP1 n=1 Tax=Scheffersomyces spartinae TaxID=45513 RepID=A0A9P8AL63_9ASCO|nr:uncharacterized protein KQ657_002154 [Scheffersomyces spartinae]KAG7195769.1 hypothetical protein KQ657_002154 [Scheffersomyces spartinae]
MSTTNLLLQGDGEIQAKDYLLAVKTFSEIISKSPKTYQAYFKRATAFQSLHNYESAISDISLAFSIAQERGKREDMGQCYYKLGLLYYAQKEYSLAETNISKAEEYNCKEPALAIWKMKIESDKKKAGIADVKPAVEIPNKKDQLDSKPETTQAAQMDSTNVDVINKHAPLKVKIRDDWYQTSDSVVVTIFAKNIKKEDIEIDFGLSSVHVSFPTANGSEYNYNMDPLFASIDPEKSDYTVYSTKIEITLVKQSRGKWNSLEGAKNNNQVLITPTEPAVTQTQAASSLAYPSSSKKKIDWANFNVDDEEEEAAGGDNAFFQRLYDSVDDDTRRAMMKSYVESNGTVLTTNWDEAKAKTFETSPPEGMEAKRWS